jgi:hypothetical protein
VRIEFVLLVIEFSMALFPLADRFLSSAYANSSGNGKNGTPRRPSLPKTKEFLVARLPESLYRAKIS